MIVTVAKTTSVNLRISPSFRNELQQLADYRGLKLSSLVHSLLVKGLRQEKQNEPEAFVESERMVNANESSVDARLREAGARSLVTNHTLVAEKDEENKGVLKKKRR